MTRQNKTISKASPDSYLFRKHCDHRVTQMTRKYQRLVGSWHMGLSGFNIRITFCNRGEWTTLIISARMPFYPMLWFSLLWKTQLTSAGLRGQQVYSHYFSWNLCVMIHTFPDFVNSAKPCHFLRNKYRKAIQLTNDINQRLIWLGITPCPWRFSM